MTLNNAENRCLRNAPSRSVGASAAVAYLARKDALWKLETPVSVLAPKNNSNPRLHPDEYLIQTRPVPAFREL